VKTIGLTGGIGSGKSTASRILAELGAEVIDADQVGHYTYRPGSEGWDRIVEAFGPDVVSADRTIDRKRLGALVFADPGALARLNAIVQPLIRTEIGDRLRRRREAGYRGPIVVEAAVLVEAGWVPLVDEVWLVVADRKAVLERVRAQRGLEPSAIEARMGSQLTDGERRRHATVVIDNSGTIASLRAEIERLWRERLDDTGGG
jgi:dephospho-CoA kinase